MRLIVPFHAVDTGSIGTEMTIDVPQITGGYGRLLSLELRLEPRFVTAECHQGKLRAWASIVLGDGSEERTEAIRPCSGG